MKKGMLFCLVFRPCDASSQNKIVVHADQGKVIINKNIYGHFAEHLGHCIYGGFYVGDTNKIIPNTEWRTK